MPQILWWKLTETWFCGGSTFHWEDFRIQWSYRRLQGRLWNGWGRALLHPFRTCWSSVPKGSPSGWEPCPATAGARLNAARSSKECSWRSVAWETHMFFSFQGSGAKTTSAGSSRAGPRAERLSVRDKGPAEGLRRCALGCAHLYSAPQPLTKLMRMVHIRVSW